MRLNPQDLRPTKSRLSDPSKRRAVRRCSLGEIGAAHNKAGPPPLRLHAVPPTLTLRPLVVSPTIFLSSRGSLCSSEGRRLSTRRVELPLRGNAPRESPAESDVKTRGRPIGGSCRFRRGRGGYRVRNLSSSSCRPRVLVSSTAEDRRGGERKEGRQFYRTRIAVDRKNLRRAAQMRHGRKPGGNSGLDSCRSIARRVRSGILKPPVPGCSPTTTWGVGEGREGTPRGFILLRAIVI